MAPRTAKAKKAADVKVADNEAPKKGRGKAKKTEETEQEVPDVEIDEKPAPAVVDKKNKRGKKVQENGDTQVNGNAEEVAPPAKKGKKKKEAEEIPEKKAANGDISEEETQTENADTESNGTDEVLPTKGRKKPAKTDKPKETKGKKGKQASPDVDVEEKEEKDVEKPKAKGRGRKPKAEAAEPEEDKPEAEEVKAEPAAKGRRKGQTKAVKEKSPEAEETNEEEIDKLDEPEKGDAPKKETKGKKGKKAQPKEEGEIEGKEPASKKRKVNKKEEKGQGDAKDEELVEDDEAEAKPKGKRGKKGEAPEAEDDPESDSTTKRRRKPEEKAPKEDAKKKAPAKNKATTNYEDLDFTNLSKNAQDKEWNFKISCWNVDGIRAWLGKGGLDYIKYEKPDILCLQETKCSKEKLPKELVNLPGYHAYWLDSDKDGYAGVGLYTTRLAMNVHYGLGNPELDNEGRIITAEYEQFYLICVYVPNAGRKLVTLPRRLEWNKEFLKHVKELDEKKPVVICGDMNVAHNEIDLANPKANRKNAGFTEEERAGMTELLGEGFVDTYRHFYPDKTAAYTFWTYMMNARGKNLGWRLDYFIVSERLLPSVCDNVIRDGVYGSDHCPITLFLHITSADKPKDA